jgi:hypothetical protein
MSYSPISGRPLGVTPPQDDLDQWCYLCNSDEVLIVPYDEQESSTCYSDCPEGWTLDLSQDPCTPLCIEPDPGESSFPSGEPAEVPSQVPTTPSAPAATSPQSAAARPVQTVETQETKTDNTGLVAAAIVVGSALLAYLAW